MAVVMALTIWFQAVSMPLDPDEAAAWAERINDMALSPLDLNRATADELARLPDLSTRQAHAIVRHRLRRGPFRRIDDLLAVSGIDPVTVDAIRPFVSIRTADHWRPNGTLRLEDGRHAVWIDSGPVSAYAGPGRRVGVLTLGARDRSARLLAGHHRVSAGLGLVQHHGLRADPGPFSHHRHGLRIRSNTSVSTTGFEGLAGVARTGPIEMALFRNGGRIQVSASTFTMGGTTSSGASGADVLWMPADRPISLAVELGRHEHRYALMTDLRLQPRRRFRIGIRYLDVQTGYAAPMAMIPLRFGRNPRGERSIAAGVMVDGWSLSVTEARSRNRELPQTDTDVRFGYDSGRFLAELRHREQPSGETYSLKAGFRFREPNRIRSEWVIEARNRSIAGRAVLEITLSPHLRFWALAGVFDADSYADRLYAWEPVGHRTGRIRSWYGRGSRSAAYVEWTPADGIVFTLSGGVTRYADRWGPSAVRAETTAQCVIRF